MNPERVIAVCAGLISLVLITAIPSSLAEYSLGSRAEGWHETSGRVIERSDINLPRFKCLICQTGYSLIEYQYEDRNGKVLTGSAQAPRVSHIYTGASISLKVNPEDQSESLPVVLMSDYKMANGFTALFSLLAPLGLLYAARRLWRQEIKLNTKTVD